MFAFCINSSSKQKFEKRCYKPMKKKLLAKRILSIVIAVVLLISAVPVSLAVQNMVFKETTSEIVREITELREESSKQFLCEDGSIIVATYSEPVHFFENGEWKEINNELTLTAQKKSSSGKATYAPKRSGISISIPQTFSDGQQITAVKDNYEIKFSLDSGNSENIDENTAAIVSKIETLPSNLNVAKTENIATVESSTLAIDSVELANEKMMEVENNSGAVVYKNILPDTDLEYIVSGCSIKENIIVHKSQSEYNYSFDIDIGNLISVKNENGSISLYETTNSETPVFHINAPYMYDSNGIESPNVDMSLVVVDGKTKLILDANKEWINSSERVFPVVIDPTFTFGNSAFEDVFVMDGVYANSTRIGNELRVGTNLTNTTRTYIKMNLPTNIPRGSEVTSASLTLKKDAFFQAWLQDDIKIYAYDGKDANAWSPTNITWNNQPNFSFDHPHTLDKIDANKDKTTYTFNILDAVSRWIEYGENNGICLRSSKEDSKTQIDFYSSRVSDTNNRPVMTFTYLLPGLSMTSWNTGTSAAFSPTINVTAAPAYEIRCSESWLSPTSKTDSSFKLHVTRNDSVYTRTATATIILKPYESAIGTVTVTQLGVEPNLMVDSKNWNVLSNGGTNSFVITSNSTWNAEVDYIDGENNDWLHISNEEFTGNATISVTADPNTQNSIRNATVTIKSGELEEKIKIVQYDEFSENFVQLNIDNTVSLKSSSEYNHSLATWAMELSYAAYNPIQSQFLPLIPSSFMHTPYDNAENTSKADLLSKGFLATEYNYEEGADIYAAHTIGHREIMINDYNTNEGGNDIDFSGNNDVVISSTGNDSASFSSVETYGNIDSFTISGNSGENILNSTDSNNTRQLVVVAVRGSVTFMDWVVDLGNQFNDEQYNFQAGMKEVIKSLYGCTELCDECKGTGCENASAGYLDNINDPIILITGHSLGAAIANLTANYLTQELGADNVYAYTFATPNTVNKANGEEPIKHNNIFNILNNNDAVPHFPMNLIVNEWERHGQDFHITMPWVTQGINLFGVDLLGALGHGMPTYYSWMNNLPTTLGKSAKDITVADLDALSVDYAVGLGAKLFKALCPVSVALYDSDGNVVAYESQQEGVVYPETTNTGIVSWIADDGGKMFLIPYGTENIEARIEAYDYGTMDFTIETLGVVEPLSSKTFNDVSVYPGKEFLVEVSEDVPPEDTQLFVTENGEIVDEITETDPHLKSVTVNHDERTTEVITYLSFVTDNTVSKIHFYNHQTGHTYYLSPDGYGSIEVDGDNLIWTAGYGYIRAGDFVYDVYVESDGEWYVYENVFMVHIPQEYIDLKNGTLETNSIQTMSEYSSAEMNPLLSTDDI